VEVFFFIHKIILVVHLVLVCMNKQSFLSLFVKKTGNNF